MTAWADGVRDATGAFADEYEGVGARMTFLEHLDELRRRIIYSLYALAATCAVTFTFMDRIAAYMLRYFAAYGTYHGGKLIFTQITEGFMFDFKVAGLAGLILASPFVFSQFWLFVAPGLYAREKRVVLPFAASATILFGAGVWFAHAIAFPRMFQFFAGFSTDILIGMFTISEVFSFYVRMVLGLGLVFELPMLVFFLARFGVVTAGFLLRKTRYAVLAIFVIAAILTPSTDPVNQCIFAAPMLVLYALSIGIAWAFGPRRRPGGLRVC
jgi:sec-independent protein translocase protein TatC